jgi:cytochrome o ubiquinol oxidase operon protein cyoD
MAHPTPKEEQNKTHGSLRSYIIGFLLSIFLTFAAYIPVVMHQNSRHELFSHELLLYFVSFLAVLQLVVQLIFFLHLLQEQKPRWNLVFFFSTISIVLIVVVGSIWIMNHLNYNMTPPQMEKFLIKDEGIPK